MGSLKFDLVDAVRSFRRDRTYVLTILLTLGVTIGATTAVFSIVNSVLLEPLAYRESHRLVALREIWHKPGERSAPMEVNERHFNYWREHARSFAAMGQYTARPANLTGAGEAARITVARASGSLFDVLQVQAAVGRTLTLEDEPEERPDVTVIGDSLWRQRFNQDRTLVGRPIVIDGKPYTVVGILPPDFQIPDRARLTAKVDAFVPLRVNVGWIGDHNNDAIGRLRQGVDAEQARAELDVLQRQVSAIATKEAHETVTLAAAATPLTDYIVGQSRRGLWLLMAAVVSVLLIACANLANLSLSRTFGRLREAAIRSALGASRSRLVARALFEHLFLALIGGALGVWFAWMALAVFVRTAPIDLPRVNEVRLDPRVLAFAAVVSVVAAMAVAVLPAWRLSGRDVQSGLRATGTAFTSDRTGSRSRAMLLTVQVALSVTLLVVTGLLAISFVRVLGIDRGFNAEHVLTVDVSLPATRYADEPVRLAVYDRMIESVRILPGVQAVTTTSMLPLAGYGQSNFIVPEGDRRPIFEQPNANFRFVAPDYFSTMGITVMRGRSFTERERDRRRPAPVVVSASTAATLWAGQDPIGKRFSRGFPEEQGFEVVGVTPEARVTSLERTPPLMVYVPYWWRSRPSLSLLVRTAGEPASILASLRRTVHEIDPDIAIGEARPLEQLVDASVAARRYQMRLFVVFGGVALFIATVGVYAVTSFGVSRRRREMNIRVALGAQASQVRRMIVGQGLSPVLAGVAIGVLGALAVGRVISSLLFDVGARDPIVIGLVAVLVTAIGAIASTVATRQGLSLDPAKALRED